MSEPLEPAPEQGPILVGWDGGDSGRDALALGALLGKELGTKVIAAHAYVTPPPVHPFPEDRLNELRGEAERMIVGIPRHVLTEVRFEALSVPGQSAAKALHELAERERARVVVLGSSERGSFGRVLPGSVAQRLIHGAPCSVAVAPHGYATSPSDRVRVILVAFDGSPESRAAAETAAAIAVAAQATLRIVAVLDTSTRGWGAAGTAMSPPDLSRLEREHLREALDGLRDRLPPELRAAADLRNGVAGRELIDAAEQGVDLIVMGSRGYGPIRSVLLGSVSETVIRHAPCPVLVVPRPVAPAAGQLDVSAVA